MMGRSNFQDVLKQISNMAGKASKMGADAAKSAGLKESETPASNQDDGTGSQSGSSQHSQGESQQRYDSIQLRTFNPATSYGSYVINEVKPKTAIPETPDDEEDAEDEGPTLVATMSRNFNPLSDSYVNIAGSREALEGGPVSPVSNNDQDNLTWSDDHGRNMTLDALYNDPYTEDGDALYQEEETSNLGTDDTRYMYGLDSAIEVMNKNSELSKYFDYNGYHDFDGMTYADFFMTGLENSPFAYDEEGNLRVQEYVLDDGTVVIDLDPEARQAHHDMLRDIVTDPANAIWLGAELVRQPDGTYEYEGGYYYGDSPEALEQFEEDYRETFGPTADGIIGRVASGDQAYIAQVMADDEMGSYIAGVLGQTIEDEDMGSYRLLDTIDVTGSGTTLGDLLPDDATDEQAAQLALAWMMNSVADYAQTEGGEDASVLDYIGGQDWRNYMNMAYGVDLTRDKRDGDLQQNPDEYNDEFDYDYLTSAMSDGGSVLDTDERFFMNALAQTPDYAYVYIQ